MNNRDIQMFQRQMNEMLKTTQEKAMQIGLMQRPVKPTQSNTTQSKLIQSKPMQGNGSPRDTKQTWKLWDNSKPQANPQQVTPTKEHIKDLKQMYQEKSKGLQTNLTSERLQEAIIWSEILGKPVSKRHKRRFER